MLPLLAASPSTSQPPVWSPAAGVLEASALAHGQITPHGAGLSQGEPIHDQRCSGDDLHRGVAVPAAYAICLEVPAIDGEDPPRAQRFGGDDERCVGQVHRMVSV